MSAIGRDARGPDVETERLVLHPIAPAEATRILAGAPGAGDRWHADYPFADELDPLRSLLVERAEPDPVFTMYQVRMRADGIAVGGIGFHGPLDANGAAEIGYGLVEGVRGRGYATEAVRAITALAFAHGAALVKADTDPLNVASQRVLLGAGFVVVDRRDGLVFFELPPPA